ncbi:hypothetical protein HBI55_114840 [Parastagonospora nodorum]|nr:hypothetical protein HBH52_060070 [Parastagonospora nodorum]KAH5044765.1 hypothetical protein HBI75_022420 [Parastagonospora nodorum]KAH5224293.1 hypothetical protein HBI62_117940 [Parastagonospora nodorum]KAH5431526.1 hypothetical protein HBI32_061770 [Parastagonospora nodorum]KAH5524360.1 hypothetical protein HBI52_049570 [Parastagonospora nodorum]
MLTHHVPLSTPREQIELLPFKQVFTRYPPKRNTFAIMMIDAATVYIIVFFVVSSYFGHQLLHRVIQTPAQYTRGEEGVR